MSDKPTGVFVRLPLSIDDIRKMDQAMSQRMMAHSKPTLESASEAAMLAIGTPIQDSVSIAAYLINDDEGMRAVLYTSRTEDVFPCVLQKHHQAALASLQAEVVRLLEDLDASKRKNFNAGYLIACCNIYNMHNEEGIASDILNELGITEDEVKALDLTEYDAKALVEIRKAQSTDPIVKGPQA